MHNLILNTIFCTIFCITFTKHSVRGMRVDNSLTAQRMVARRLPAVIRKEITNREVTSYAKEYDLPFRDIETIFETLKILNIAPNIKTEVEGKVCTLNYDTVSANLKTSLQTIKQNKVNLARTCVVSPTTTPIIKTTTTAKFNPFTFSTFGTIIPCRCGGIGISRPQHICCQRRKRSTVVVNNVALRNEIFKELQVPHDARPGTTLYKRGNCLSRGYDRTHIDTKVMCKECQYEVELPSRFFPQIHTHIVCGKPNSNTCLTNQGLCGRIVRTQPIVEVGYNQETEFELKVTTGCQCEVRQNSHFAALVH